MIDLISRADAIEAVASITMSIHLSDVICDKLLALPSADAVDCTDFVNWLLEEVMDEEMWELNAVANGEIICRKLEKLGVLEATEEPSYYIRPSADAEQKWNCTASFVAEQLDRLRKMTDEEKWEFFRKFFGMGDAVQGEWKIDEYGIYHCPFCHAINNTVYKSFCPNCGARMKGGAE